MAFRRHFCRVTELSRVETTFLAILLATAALALFGVGPYLSPVDGLVFLGTAVALLVAKRLQLAVA